MKTAGQRTGVAGDPATIVVIGNGMVGHRFCERLVELRPEGGCRIIVFGEEPRPAYDRVHLSDFFSGRSVSDLTLADRDYVAGIQEMAALWLGR